MTGILNVREDKEVMSLSQSKTGEVQWARRLAQALVLALSVSGVETPLSVLVLVSEVPVRSTCVSDHM